MTSKPLPPELRSLARKHTSKAINTLAGIMCSEEHPGATRVSAAAVLLDRGWGKPSQPVTGEDGEGPIIVEIIHRTREK